MKAIPKYLLAILVGLACGYFLRKPAAEYKFSNHPPHFSERQKEIIKNVYGKIVEQLKDPSSVYIGQVDESNSKIVVYLFRLENLQDGEERGNGEIRMTMDGQVSFVFDKAYNLISTSKGG